MWFSGIGAALGRLTKKGNTNMTIIANIEALSDADLDAVAGGVTLTAAQQRAAINLIDHAPMANAKKAELIWKLLFNTTRAVPY
jgi:hypothetical protein